ncbi:serine/arginine repetitive matrix protein 2-like [Patiria miniata]|uniref:FAM65 N-terminal domain-containing protein n=1 Tax=Patiria miniata TaxID=46514 RepID=A0A913ZPQ3_PATMI|nr:serine/arginine repetitive matrix protein 2-like [Patiria miniata]
MNQRPRPHSSGSPEQAKSMQQHADMANIPESGPKMVTLLRVSPRDASVSSRRQRSKTALQEKKSQYLEYASQVEERRRQSLQAGRKAGGQNHGSRNNVARTRNGAGREPAKNPQLANRPLSEAQKPRQPPSKPQRHFSQSPPRQVTRQPDRLPNGQYHGPQNHRQENHPHAKNNQRIPPQMTKPQESSTPKRQPRSLYPLPPSTNRLQTPLAPVRTSRSPNRPPSQQPTKAKPDSSLTQVKIRAEVHTTTQSSSSTSPHNSLPVGSLPPGDNSILSWFDKMEAQDSVSYSFPPSARSQSNGPQSRGSASKVELRNDLKQFEMSMDTRRRVSSPEARSNRSRSDLKSPTSGIPVAHERRSRLDNFAKSQPVSKTSSHASLSQQQAKPSKIPVKKESMVNLRHEAPRRTKTVSDPEPPLRQRKSQSPVKIPATTPSAKSKIPSMGSEEPRPKQSSQHPGHSRESPEPQPPPRHRKGSQDGSVQNRTKQGQKQPSSSERNGKSSVISSTSPKQDEQSQSKHSGKEATETSSASHSINSDSLDLTPRRPMSTSPRHQELRRRLSEILMERRNRDNGTSDAIRIPTSPKREESLPSEVEGGDVIDNMLDSTLEQDFKGELKRNLARRKSKLDQSLKETGPDVSSVGDGASKIEKDSQTPDVKATKKIELDKQTRDSGLGASYESQSNQLPDAAIGGIASGHSSKSSGEQTSPKEVEFVISEWSDESEAVQPTRVDSPPAVDGDAPSTSIRLSPSPPPPDDSPRDDPKRKVRLRRWSISSDSGERPHVAQRPVSYSNENKPETSTTSILSSMKVGISVPDLSSRTSSDDLMDRESSLDDSSGLLNVKDIEEEIEKSSSANTSSVQSTPCRSTVSQEVATPQASSPSQDFDEDSLNSVPSSPRRITPPNERLIQTPPSHLLERSHQSLRQLPVKVLPTSPRGETQPTFSEDHDMSIILPSPPTTPAQPSQSPTDSNQKKSRYLKITGMQLLPQKLQLLGSKDKSKSNQVDETDRQKQGLYKKSEYRGRDSSKKDFSISAFARSKKRSASADGFFPIQRERSPSPLGLRGFGTPSRQGKLKDRRGRQKMLTPPGNHALKMPRQPRPHRMHTILESLKKGLKDTIEVSKEKLTVMEEHQHDPNSTSFRQGFHYNLEKQIKVAERYIRKLQFHLAKVEEVHEQYDKELKVREGAVNVVKAYADTNLPHAKEPCSEAKAGVRDCTQSLCQMEAELEANLGAFVVRIDGIAGFARVCRGDIFEVVFKYGLQKWRMKCKVEKDLSQSWDIDEIVMYPMLADFLTIKVTEMRGIARSNMVIGNLEFDTSDFYQADPQTLTIDVNENGTIKLNLVVTWSPFHINEEMYKSPKNSYSRRERAFTESVISTSKTFNNSVKESPKSPKKFLPKTLDLNTSRLTLTLEEAMHNVTRLLEILKGQYTELELLEKQVGSLNDLLKRIRERKKRESTMSIQVKTALESFDFLNEVDGDDGPIDSGSGSMDENRSSFASDEFCKSQSSDRLSDCASLDDALPRCDSSPSLPSYSSPSPLPQNLPMTRANRGSRIINMSEKRESRLIEMNEQRERRLVDSPGETCWEEGSETGPKLTTNNDSIDMVLVQHLMYIEYLLSHLGAFGPLKLKETVALQKLKKQAVIIEQLLVLAVTSTPITRADDVFPELKLNPLLLEFWQHCAEKEALYVNAESFLLQLDVKFGAKLRTSHPDIADDVFQSLCNRIIERPVDLYHPKTIISLFQYIGFFATDDRKNPEKFINDLTKDFELTASLEPSNPELLKVMKKLPKGSLLSTGNLRALGLLLLEDRATIQMGVRVYLESLGGDEKLRKKAVNVYLECLEERDLSLRQAGCAAIAALKAREALDQLLYLLRCDMDDVKSTAKEALMAFGEEGKQAYEQISYTPYGQYNHDYSEIDVPLMTTEL